jgi:hypothetical protein
MNFFMITVASISLGAPLAGIPRKGYQNRQRPDVPVITRYRVRGFSWQFSSLAENNRRARSIVLLSSMQSLRDCGAV